MQSSLYDKNIKRNYEPVYDKKYVLSKFESCLRYSIILWGGDNESDELFKLQKKVLRIISGVNNRT
jgi:hypothetical protein